MAEAPEQLGAIRKSTLPFFERRQPGGFVHGWAAHLKVRFLGPKRTTICSAKVAARC